MKMRFIYLILILTVFCGSANAEAGLSDVRDLITNGKFEAAVSQCEILISSFGDSISEVLLEKGIALYYLWDKENALKVVDRQYPLELAISAFQACAALNVNGVSDIAFKWIGDCYFFAMRFEEASHIYSEFEAHYSENKYLPIVKYRKGKTFEKLGDYEKAITVYQGVISDYPDFQFIKTVRFDCMRLISILEKR